MLAIVTLCQALCVGAGHQPRAMGKDDGGRGWWQESSAGLGSQRGSYLEATSSENLPDTPWVRIQIGSGGMVKEHSSTPNN